MYADLHLHSTASDGTDSPEALVDLAQRHRVRVVAITDHDAVNGALAAMGREGAGIRVIPGVEISTELGHRYLHILGYHLNLTHPKLAGYLSRAAAEKTKNTRINFDNAMAQGCFAYDWARVSAHHPGQPRLSGVHVVQAMQKDGFIIPGMPLWHMFRRFFLADGPEYIPTETATAYDAIDVIKAAGGVPVVAHPGLGGDDTIVLDLVRYGAQGIECHHPQHTAGDTRRYLELAQAHGLLVTGGTDWHGENSGQWITRFGMCGLVHSGYPILHAR